MHIGEAYLNIITIILIH